MAKVIYEFDYHEEAETLEIFRNAVKYHIALSDIYNTCRTYLNHTEEEISADIELLIEGIMEEAGIVDD